MTQIELISHLVDTMKQAIRSGDWIVDGACDPDIYISIAETILKQDEGICANILERK